MKNFIPLLALTLLACAPQAKQAASPADLMRPIPLGRIVIEPGESVRFTNNKLFLWRADMTAEHVEKASRISERLDTLDERALAVQRDVARLEAEQAPAIEERTQVERAIKTLGRSIPKKQKEIDTEMAKPEPDRDLEKLKKLQAELAALQGDLTKNDTRKAELNLVLKDFDALLVEQDALAAEGQAAVGQIMEVVDWYKEQPTSVVLRRERDGSYFVSISGWRTQESGSAEDFSTTNGKILGIQYTELGGVLEFEARSDSGESYFFKIARARYGELADPYGRIFMRGDIRRVEKDGSVRMGKAKLVAGHQE
jgi:hypothetical protein